jgi:hypothetical protein
MTCLEDIITQQILFLKIISLKFSSFNYLICDIVTCHFKNVTYSLCYRFRFMFVRKITIINTHYIP